MRTLDLLLHLDSYPVPTGLEAVSQAVRFAGVLDATLTALAIQVDLQVPNNKLADILVGLSRLAEEEEAKSSDACRQLLERFLSEAEQASVAGKTLLDRADFMEEGRQVAKHARTRDACLIPIGDASDHQRGIVEAVLFESGRPAILFAPGRADLPRTRLGRVVVAWDGSHSAARALFDAMPLLEKAKSAIVFTVLDDKRSAVSGMGAEPVRLLRDRGIVAVPEQRSSEGQPVGQVFQKFVVEAGAEMLVMGAYGHSRLREFVLGGATQHMLANPSVAMLLSH